MQLFQTDRFKLTVLCFFSNLVSLMINGSGDNDDDYPQTCRNYNNEKKCINLMGLGESYLTKYHK